MSLTEWEIDDNMCPSCAGELEVLGRLCDLLHLQCRDCGSQVSSPLTADERYQLAPVPTMGKRHQTREQLHAAANKGATKGYWR